MWALKDYKTIGREHVVALCIEFIRERILSNTSWIALLEMPEEDDILNLMNICDNSIPEYFYEDKKQIRNTLEVILKKFYSNIKSQVP